MKPAIHNFFLPQFQAALGTVVHATPLVEALKAALPQARIIVASSGLAAQVWENNPLLECLLQTPNPLQDFAGAVKAFRRARLFGGERYVTLLTTGNERTKITLAALLAGKAHRIGFAVHGALVHTHLRFDPSQSQIANNLRLLSACGVANDARQPVEPRIYPTVVSDHFADDLLAPIARPRIVLATQTSVTQRKGWPRERWIELAHALRSRYGAELIFIGTAAEAEAIEDVRRVIALPTTSVAGATTIQQLAAVLARCDLGIMLDTGPLHVARAMQLPAVIIAPAWSPVHEWLPIGNARYRILKNADFAPPAPDNYVIEEVSVAEVLQAAAELLAMPDSAVGEAERTPGS